MHTKSIPCRGTQTTHFYTFPTCTCFFPLLEIHFPKALHFLKPPFFCPTFPLISQKRNAHSFPSSILSQTHLINPLSKHHYCSSFMGAAFAKDSIPPCSSSNSSSFEDIPENCISIVLTYLDPPEICNLARVNRAFRAASSADFVWESKLPSNYFFLLRRVLNVCYNHDLQFSKKEIFAMLTRPNLFDHATKVTITFLCEFEPLINSK